jgi:hypothetical protein
MKHKGFGNRAAVKRGQRDFQKGPAGMERGQYQIAAARLFGIIASPSGGKYRLTDLGASIIDPTQSREARVTAFLNVPLYRAVFDKYRGGVLPGQAAAMERELVGLGVSEKVKDRARQVFERSAEQAGFFAHGRNRLVMPGIAARQPDAPIPPDSAEEEAQQDLKKGGNGGGGENTGVDPIIAGLLKRLPKSGDKWPKAQRKLWLQLLEGSFDLIYDDVEAPTEAASFEEKRWRSIAGNATSGSTGPPRHAVRFAVQKILWAIAHAQNGFGPVSFLSC